MLQTRLIRTSKSFALVTLICTTMCRAHNGGASTIRRDFVFQPDESGVEVGAVEIASYFESDLSSGWTDSFTGAGCLQGSFKVEKCQFKSFPDGSSSFTVHCEVDLGDFAGAKVVWSGLEKGGDVTGDVWISLPGVPKSFRQIEEKRRSDRLASEAQTVYLNGLPLNLQLVEALKARARGRNALIPAVGRTIHYTIKMMARDEREKKEIPEASLPEN